MDKEMKVFVSKNTPRASWRPQKGKRIILTAVQIQNHEERPVCIRVDIGKKTRFLAYLDRQKKRINEISVRLPVPLSGQKNEPVSVQTFEQHPISVALAGYEV